MEFPDALDARHFHIRTIDLCLSALRAMRDLSCPTEVSGTLHDHRSALVCVRAFLDAQHAILTHHIPRAGAHAELAALVLLRHREILFEGISAEAVIRHTGVVTAFLEGKQPAAGDLAAVSEFFLRLERFAWAEVDPPMHSMRSAMS